LTRVGTNPNKKQRRDWRPARVSGLMVTHLPNTKGYHEGRLAVIETAIRSMVMNAGQPLELFIWDNASCGAGVKLLRGLQAEGLITGLMLCSQNAGAALAKYWLTRMAPGEIVAYSDDDVYYYPGWLRPQLELLEGFPRVGAVTGAPLRSMFDWGISSVLAFGQRPDARISRGRFIPEQWERDFARSVGRDPETHLRERAASQDIVLEYAGLRAYGTAHHMQFVAWRDVIAQFEPDEPALMGSQRAMDERIDNQGYLRLATTERLTRHIGNVLDAEIAGLPIGAAA